MKTCRTCNVEKPTTDFYKIRDGYLRLDCKKCHNKDRGTYNLGYKRKTFDIKCFRCNKEFKCRKKSGYCSYKCKHEGLRERIDFQIDRGHKIFDPFTRHYIKGVKFSDY